MNDKTSNINSTVSPSNPPPGVPKPPQPPSSENNINNTKATEATSTINSPSQGVPKPPAPPPVAANQQPQAKPYNVAPWKKRPSFDDKYKAMTQEHVIASSEPPKPHKTNYKKIILTLLALILIGGAATGGVVLYKFIYSPLRILVKSFDILENSSSFTIGVDLNSQQDVGKVSAIIDYHNSPYLFSQVKVNMEEIGQLPGNNLKVNAIINKMDTFLQADYSNLDLFENEIRFVYPQIPELATYKLVRPLLTGDKWLHILNQDGESSQDDIQVSPDKEKELNNLFKKSIIVRSFDKNYSEGGKSYYKIVLGFDKQNLLSFVEELKTLDLSVELKDINSLIKIINSVDNWDSDLITFLVDKDDNTLYTMSISIPEIPKDALEAGIKEGVDSTSGASYFSDLFTQKVTDFLEPSTSSNLIYIGKLTITNYNSAPVAAKPENILEISEIEDAFQSDLPYLLQLFVGTSEDYPLNY